MPYSISFRPAALRELRALPLSDQERIQTKINALAERPFPPGCKKIKGSDWFRIRVGDYRIIYNVQSQELVILIIRIGHRREVYR